MNLLRLTIAFVLAVCITATGRDQLSTLPAVKLIDEVVANELTDRVQQRKWMYLIDKRQGKQTLTEEQVDTKDGPFYRVLAIDGIPLDSNQRQQDKARMDRLLHDPGLQLKIKQVHDEDEQKLEKLIRLLPEAFVYDYDGIEENLIRLKFRPNSNDNPPTYEARVAHSRFRTEASGKTLGPTDKPCAIRVWALGAHRRRRHNRDWARTGRTLTMEDCVDQHSIVGGSGVLQDNQQTRIRDSVEFPRGFRRSQPFRREPASCSLD